MKRKPNGAGSIVHCKDGRYVGRYFATMPDGTRKRQSIYGRDYQTVAIKMREEMALADKGTPVLHDNRTVGEYIEYWLKHISAPRVRENTQDSREEFFHRAVIPYVGHIRLSALRPEHVLQMLAQLRANGKSPDMQKRAKQSLSMVLKDAMKYGVIHRNVTLIVDTPKHKSPERKVWGKAQVNIFLDHLKSINHRLYPLFEFLFYYGTRGSEALGLRWSDVDFEKDVIRIRHTIVKSGKKRIFSAPKTEMSIRDLPLLPNIRRSLFEHLGKEPNYEDGLVFHGINGNPVCRRSLLKTFKNISRQLGLPVITIHETRHTQGTLLKNSGVSPKDTQVLMGHADIITTLQIYVHSDEESRLAAMNALSANLSC